MARISGDLSGGMHQPEADEATDSSADTLKLKVYRNLILQVDDDVIVVIRIKNNKPGGK